MCKGTILEKINHAAPAINPTPNGSGEDFKMRIPMLNGRIQITQHIA
jgi:hypothetical protein